MRRLSQTQIRTYQDCPQRWKQIYVDGRREPPGAPLTFGSAVHAGLETFYRNRIAAPARLDEVLAAFDAELDPAAYPSPQEYERAKSDGHALLRAWHEKHAPGFRPALAVEQRLEFEVEGIPVVAILDRVDALEDGRIRISDYKTGKFFLRDKAEESEQLTLYQMGAEEKLERQVASLSLVHVPSDTEWTVPRRSDEEIAAVRRLVAETARAIEREEFEPRTGRHCDWCHAKPWCPAFADQYPENWPQQLDALSLAPADAAALADELGDAQEEKRRAEARIRAAHDALVPWLEETGVRSVAGDRFRVKVSRSERNALACSDEELRSLLEPEGLWERVLAPAHHMKTRLLADADLSPDVRQALDARCEPRVSWRLTPRPVARNDEGDAP